MLMVWDEPKRLSNIKDHGLDFIDARERFEWETAMVERAHSGKDGRERYLATGFLDAALVTLIFSILGTEAISAVSLRSASQKERRRYDEED